ncbi:MAG TPA: cardiolipin synthase [Xanthomonadaceae bacterium]|nr:cardiolipin synthase [Xanthomonadaceae bacterium]
MSMLSDYLIVLLAAGWLVNLVLLAGWIVMQKREPVATLSWVLALATLPVVGFVLYWLFGPERIKRQRLRRARSRAAVDTPLQRDSEDVAASGVAKLAAQVTGYLPSTCTHVQLLVDSDKFEALLAAVCAARHHVHLEYYIFEPDATGRMVRDALIERARAGVKVRLLLDAFGGHRLSRRFLKPMRAAGIQIGWFHPLRLRRIPKLSMNLRTHRKLVVVDGQLAFAGGINICDESNRRHSAGAFHDLHVRLEGRIAHWLQLAFLEDWHYATGVALRDEALWPSLPAGEISAQVLPSGPDSPWRPIERVFVAAIHSASERVWLVTPYFVPTEPALLAVTAAAQRGLDVRLLVPRCSDSWLVTQAARSYFDELQAAGVRIFEYRAPMLHSKALLVDRGLCLVGSANFDQRSFALNFELAVLFRDEGVCTHLQRQIEADLAQSDPVPAPRRTPLPMRLAEASARLLSPLL